MDQVSIAPHKMQNQVEPSSSDLAPRLELRGVSKSYGGVMAMDSVDLAVPTRQFLTILGPSGSGKTTMLRLIAGFVTPDRGAILISGHDVSRLPPSRRSIGMVFQHYALFPHMTVADNVAYGLRMHGWKKERRASRVSELLKLVDLSTMDKRLPREMSGGQQQRVALARALAFGPDLLLMDEPLGALDRELRVMMTSELRRIHQEVGVTAVYVTHDREEALTLSDRIALMHNGRVEATGTPEELFTTPQTPFVARFFGGHNLVPGVVTRTVDAKRVRVRMVGSEVETATSVAFRAGEECVVSVPQHAIRFTGAETAAARVSARVLDTMFLGDAVRAKVNLGHEVTVEAMFAVSEGSAAVTGADATAYLDVSQLVALKPDPRAMDDIYADTAAD